MVGRPRTIWGRLWRWLPEPRATRWLVLIIYSVAVVLGGSTLADMPDQVEAATGHGLTVAMGVLLIVGGLIGAMSVPGGSWRVERGAILFIAAAAAIYIMSILLGSYPAADTGERAIRVGWIVIVTLMLAARMTTIWGANTDPDIDPNPPPRT